MVSKVGLPRVRTAFSVVCLLLVLTFCWDLIALHRLSSPRQTQRHAALRHGHSTNHSRIWSWRCVVAEDSSKFCQRFMSSELSNESMSFATCTMTCSPESRIWPLPTGQLNIGRSYTSFHPHQLKINFTSVSDPEVSTLLKNLTRLFQKRISQISEKSYAHTSVKYFVVTIRIAKSSKDYKYKLNIDESYKLIVRKKGTTLVAEVTAATFLGIHHSLETLSQLIWWDDRHKVLNILNNVVITDSPIFSYRGLLLDTARNFIPIQSILSTIDAMSMNKMNVFHWHMTDSKSFPFASEEYPGFKKYGPYSCGEIYTKQDIQQVVEYSFVRGVTVTVEIGALSHAGEGWGWGEEEKKGNLSLCLGLQPFAQYCNEPPCGQLNPANGNSSLVLAGLLKELSIITKAENLMHVGGDDVDLECWETMAEVTDMKVYLSKGVSGLWSMFYKDLLLKISNSTKIKPRFIMWSNDLLDDERFWRNLVHSSPIIQSQGSSVYGELERLLSKKFQVIVSSRDIWSLGEPSVLLSVYRHRPWAALSPADRKLVLGGEAAAWTDKFDHHTLDSRLWPLASAIAERLWSDPLQELAATDRLAWFRERMVRLGVLSSPVGPQWCLYNPNQCL